MLLSQGNDPGNFTDAEFDAALDKLKKAVDTGQIRKFTGNDYTEDLSQGRHRRLHRLVRRRDPAQRRQPGHQVRRARRRA